MTKDTSALSLGLDLGTTTVSAVVVDTATGLVLAGRTEKSDAWISSSDPREKLQSPQTIQGLAREILDSLLDRFPHVRSIGITGQMHGILYVDRQLTPVSPLYTWQDQRSAGHCRQIRDLTGHAVSPGYGLATHYALTREAALPQSVWKLTTIMDYVAASLCGTNRLITHATNAASLGLFRLEEGCFDEAALEGLGIDPGLLPEVTRSAKTLGFYRGIPVTVPIGDNQASFLGSVENAEHMALANFGTGSQISRMCRRLPRISQESGLELRPLWEDSYLVCGSALCGGRAYALLEGFFRRFAQAAGMGDEELFPVLNALALEGLALQALPTVTPTFSGTRADPSCRGSITALTEETFTPAAVTAGLLLGMSRELREMLDAMPGDPVLALTASGNAVRKNPALQQALETVFRVPVNIPIHREEAAFGAALFAAACRRGVSPETVARTCCHTH